VVARLEAIDDDDADELSLLRLERKRKSAELDRTLAQKNLSTTALARARQLNEQRTIGESALAKAEADALTSSSELEIKQIEIAEVELRIDRLQKRRTRIKEILKHAERAKIDRDPQPKPPGEGSPR
jgi:hypothetical protein